MSTDSTIEYATLQDGTLAVASGQTLTLDGVTLDSVILLGGTDDLDGATSTVGTDSTIQFATLQDGTLTVASGETLTLDGVDARQRHPVGRHRRPRQRLLGGEHRQHRSQNATLQDGTLAVASGQTLTLDGVTLDNVTLVGRHRRPR